MTVRHTQSLEVVDLVKRGHTLADALSWVLGGIRDSSRPRTSEVADEARTILEKTQ